MSKPTVTFTTEENRVIIHIESQYTVSEYVIAMTKASTGLNITGTCAPKERREQWRKGAELAVFPRSSAEIEIELV